MTDTQQVWLVERSYGVDEDLVTLVYATEDGRQTLTEQRSHRLLAGQTTTASRTVPTGRLESVADDDTRDRYRTEAARMADRHDPDEAV